MGLCCGVKSVCVNKEGNPTLKEEKHCRAQSDAAVKDDDALDNERLANVNEKATIDNGALLQETQEYTMPMALRRLLGVAAIVGCHWFMGRFSISTILYTLW